MKDENVVKPVVVTKKQLEIDAINVLEHRVNINTFPKEYQQQIRDFYRFHPVSVNSSAAGAVEQSVRGSWK